MINDIQAFQNYLLSWHKHYGRTHLPWRDDYDPYKVLVSELMLQQTQVERVIPKFNAFLERFPTVQSLSQASLAEVLTMWQGLGYNRRAKFLHQTAQAVVTTYNGVFPQTTQELLALPGIGPYTASAIMAFSFNQPVVVIETNIRTVFIHHFFPNQDNVSDQQLVELIEQSIYRENPRLWYSILMDYGSTLKKLLPNPSRKSKTYSKQSNFIGSPRQVRGEIIRILTQQKSITVPELEQQITGNKEFYYEVLQQLENEKMIVRDESTVKLG